ncbi:MAG: orotate phosphoribosyltransferase [Bryobacterales bacterium]|nr:orotate phosphoribosyltransferase [Bryobacterales bacterium]
MPDTDRERLRALLSQYSVRFGEFTLASGQKSNVYVDVKQTAYRAEAMPLIGRLLLEKLAAEGWRPAAVGGLTLGADPIAMAIAHESARTATSVDAFVVRKEPKSHGTMRYIEGPVSAPADVVVLDDVCTTGGSTIKAVERVREAGYRVLGALCVVDREMGARENLAAAGCPLAALYTLSEFSAAERGQSSGT